MEVDLNLLPFQEYQDLCMCLFYNELIPLASFLPVHKFLIEENILQDLFLSLKMLAVNRSQQFRPGTEGSSCCHHLLFLDVHISHHISGRYFIAQYSKEGRSYLMSSVISFCYKSSASFRKVIAYLSMGCRSCFEH